jgi:hypothetical protein
MDKNGKLIARIIGGASLAFGIASGVTAVWAIDQQFAIRGFVQVSAALVVIVFLSIAAFCCLVGYRLAFNRLIATDYCYHVGAGELWVFLLHDCTDDRGDHAGARQTGFLAWGRGIGWACVGQRCRGVDRSQKRRVLAHVPVGNLAPSSGGFVTAGFLSGLFHCAGLV